MATSCSRAPKDIITYLSSFEDGTLVSLYANEFTSLTVFRSLRGLAKQYVMNLVLCSEPVDRTLVEQWALPSAAAHHKAAMYKLRKLKLIEKCAHAHGVVGIKLNADFQHCLSNVIFGKSSTEMMYITEQQTPDSTSTSSLRIAEQHPSAETITKTAKQKWERILTVLVGVGDNINIGDSKVNRAAIILLREIGLIKQNKTGPLQITADGFKFLFQDLHAQIWQLIISYVEKCESRDLDRREALTLLFKLSFLTANKPYSTQSFNDAQKCVLLDLVGMGLIFQKDQHGLLFYPTYLAKYLSSGHSLTKQERDDRGYIFVESTFKVYAYTSSPLQIRLLSKFIRLDYRLPNLVAGKISKQSVMEAVSRGIPVDLIIDYLEQYAHKRMKEKHPILPIHVVDQMRLWEADNQRMRIDDAFMICLIPTDREFDEFIEVVTARENDERSTLLADHGAPDAIQAMIQHIDTFVNENCQTSRTLENDEHKESDKQTRMEVDAAGEADESTTAAIDNSQHDSNRLLRQVLPPLIDSLLQKMEHENQHSLKSKYLMTLKKYGYNEQDCMFAKQLNVNDLMKCADDLCAIHLSYQDMQNSSSKLLWSSKAEKTMVVTPKGRDVLKRHRSQKRSQTSSATGSAASTPASTVSSSVASSAPPVAPQ